MVLALLLLYSRIKDLHTRTTSWSSVAKIVIFNCLFFSSALSCLRNVSIFFAVFVVCILLLLRAILGCVNLDLVFSSNSVYLTLDIFLRRFLYSNGIGAPTSLLIDIRLFVGWVELLIFDKSYSLIDPRESFSSPKSSSFS